MRSRFAGWNCQCGMSETKQVQIAVEYELGPQHVAGCETEDRRSLFERVRQRWDDVVDRLRAVVPGDAITFGLVAEPVHSKFAPSPAIKRLRSSTARVHYFFDRLLAFFDRFAVLADRRTGLTGPLGISTRKDSPYLSGTMKTSLVGEFFGQTTVTGCGDVSSFSKVVVPSANDWETSIGRKSTWNS